MAFASGGRTEKSVETDARATDALRVHFYWQRDRYCHVISGRHEGDWLQLLTSDEGGDPAEWPISPPFQEVTVEERQAGQVALLVGMAGNSHWSASVECESSPARMSFDVACLARREPARLCSTYRIVAPGSQQDAEGLVLFTPSVRYRLRAFDRGEAACRLAVGQTSATIHVRAGPQPSRWKYEIVAERQG